VEIDSEAYLESARRQGFFSRPLLQMDKTAQAKYEEAQKLMTGGKTTWLFFKEGPDYLKAAELFNEAGNGFKAAKAWKEGGDSFMKAAEADILAGEPEEASRRHTSAASCYKKCDPEKAVAALKLAVDAFLKAGRFHMAAAHEKEIAEIYESLLDDCKNAAVYYEKAADRYVAEDATATALSCQLKAANLAAVVEDYPKAVEVFSAIVKQWAGDELKKYSMKDYLFRLGLCMICSGDLVHARREVEKFVQIDRNFSTCHEHTLLTVPITSVCEHIVFIQV
jgi:alpha-soluble NSF attachment protein